MTCPIGYQQRGNVCVANLDDSNTVAPTPTGCAPGEIRFHSVHVDQRRGIYRERTENVTRHCRPIDGRSLPEVVTGRTDLCRPNYAVSIWEGGGDDEIRCLDRNFSARRLAMPHVPTNPISPRPYGVPFDVNSPSTSTASNLWALEFGMRLPAFQVNFSTPSRSLDTPLSSSFQLRLGATYRRFDPNGVNFSAGLHVSRNSTNGYEPPTSSALWSDGTSFGGTISATIGYPALANERGGVIPIIGAQASAYALTNQSDNVGRTTHDTGLAEINPFAGLDVIFNQLQWGPFSSAMFRMTGGYLWGHRIGDSGLTYRTPTMDMTAGVGW